MNNKIYTIYADKYMITSEIAGKIAVKAPKEKKSTRRRIVNDKNRN